MSAHGELPFTVRGYCGTCRKEFGEARPDSLGYRIKCKPDHLAQVIAAGNTAAWWLRREAWLRRWQTVYSPFAVLRRQWSSLQAGPFILVLFGIIGIALVFEGADPPTSARCLSRAVLGPLLAWRFVDILLSNTSITFTTRFAQSPIRSVLLSFASYVQAVLCYAYAFCLLRGSFMLDSTQHPSNLAIEAMYSSVGTIATVGYGALKPIDAIGKTLVASELVVGLYFVVIILAQVSAWSSHSKVELGEHPWQDVKGAQHQA